MTISIIKRPSLILGLLTFAIFLAPLVAFSEPWKNAVNCDKGIFAVDYDTTSPSRQIIFRGHLVNWLVFEKGLLSEKNINSKHEIVLPLATWAGRHYVVTTGTYLQALAINLENYYPRLEFYLYNPKYGSKSQIETYFVRDCEGL